MSGRVLSRPTRCMRQTRECPGPNSGSGVFRANRGCWQGSRVESYKPAPEAALGGNVKWNWVPLGPSGPARSAQAPHPPVSPRHLQTMSISSPAGERLGERTLAALTSAYGDSLGWVHRGVFAGW